MSGRRKRQVSKNRRLNRDITDAKRRFETRKANRAPFGYVVCPTCGYERALGAGCGFPCV